MHELSQQDFNEVKPLLTGAPIHPEILSVIEGNNPGWIFVDQLVTPKSALVWSKGMQGFYIIGDHTNELFIKSLDSYISSHIAPRMKKLGLEYFEVSGQHNEWNLALMFPSRKLYPFEQMVFKLFHKPVESLNNAIRIINLKMLDWEDLDLKNIEFVHDNIDLFWSSKEDFRAKGYGYAAVEGTEIMGVCYSSFVTEDTHAIGIETLSKYRNRGVGTHLAALVAEDILTNGFTPYWDCSLDNEASRKLALRLGFQQIHQYKCSAFSI
ncbi:MULTISPECIES: GNAT family N-acetyltransferase [unclassified Paenibacillus]|uniref:GNAT family N-acetyltransferase n=1 Tax=unclassified Paenibacillus TaxID=185978 RepID=UPI0030CDAA8C